MNILVIGGTRFFGVHLVRELISCGHEVTIATRGIKKDPFGKYVSRLTMDLTDQHSIRSVLYGRRYDVVFDNMGYCSNEIKHILDNLECGRFIHTSTAGVYKLDHFDIAEEEFDGNKIELVWCDRAEMPYDDVKRQAEAALCQKYRGLDWAAVRFPIVLGQNDYTNRLFYYVEHAVLQKPMNVSNLDCRLGFAQAEEIGRFLAFLCEKEHAGPVNACAQGTVSLREMIEYAAERSGTVPVFDGEGSRAPFDSLKSFSLSVEKAQNLGFHFSDIHEWLYGLLDYYIDCVKRTAG